MGSDEGARTHAHIHVELIEIEPLDGLLQGAEGANFIDAPQHTSGSQRESQPTSLDATPRRHGSLRP